MCSPARDLAAAYHAVCDSAYLLSAELTLCAVGTFNGRRPNVSARAEKLTKLSTNHTGERYLEKPKTAKTLYTQTLVSEGFSFLLLVKFN